VHFIANFKRTESLPEQIFTILLNSFVQ